jgi:hypothetical protein
MPTGSNFRLRGFRLDADQPIDVATQIVTFQPGGFSGWQFFRGLRFLPCGQER